MHLFISNFNSRFITKTITSFLGIALFYYSVVACVPKAKDSVGLTEWQGSILKAQEYVFSEENWSIVTTGSSELFNAHIEDLSSDAYNLCFVGKSSATGLDLVLKKAEKPKVVFVEMNDTIAQPSDNEIVEKTSFLNLFPWNREKTRPDYLLHRIRMAMFSYIKQKIHYSRTIIEKTDADKLKFRQEMYSTKLDDIALCSLKKGGIEAKTKIEILEREGVRVFLVEPPFDKSLEETPRIRQIREVLTEIFPKDRYSWIVVDWGDKDYITSDGIHLWQSSGEKFAKLLLSRAEAGIAVRKGNVP